MFGDQSLELGCVLVEVAEGSRASSVIYRIIVSCDRLTTKLCTHTVFAAIFFAEIVGLHGQKVIGAFGGGGGAGAGHNGDQEEEQEIGDGLHG